MLGEIVLPETRPETEWIGGQAVQKVVPTRKHGKLQFAFASAINAWCGNRGDVVTEWRLRVSLPGEDIHPLVPDVAYMSYARLRPLSPKDREVPPVAPEIVVEILSPDDRPANVEIKRKEYVAWGVSLILLVDPEAHGMNVYGSDGTNEYVAASVETYSPAVIPDLQFPMRAMFAELDRVNDIPQ